MDDGWKSWPYSENIEDRRPYKDHPFIDKFSKGPRTVAFGAGGVEGDDQTFNPSMEWLSPDILPYRNPEAEWHAMQLQDRFGDAFQPEGGTIMDYMNGPSVAPGGMSQDPRIVEIIRAMAQRGAMNAPRMPQQQTPGGMDPSSGMNRQPYAPQGDPMIQSIIRAMAGRTMGGM